MAGTVGIDVGGTYTDLYFSGGDGGVERVIKVPSTPKDPSIGLLDALRAAEIKPDDLDQILHGTTIATNAVIERRGARCALITTRGFRDILELGRRDRPNMYGLTGIQRPLIPRDCRWEVDERLDYQGNVLVPLRARQVRELAQVLKAENVDAVVVSLLHSYANPAHEEEIRDILHEMNPAWEIVISSGVIREYYEFERTSTAVVQGYLQPLVSRYAKNLLAKLDDWGFDRQTLIMQSNGGRRAGEPARQPRGLHRALGSGGRRDGGGRACGGSRLRPHHHRRHGRHQLRRRGGDRGQACDRREHAARLPHSAAPADDRRAHDRRGRRQHRAYRSRRHPAGRAGKRRRLSGPGVLGPRRHAADGDRRECRAGAHRSVAADRH